jgi:CO dehydrogenase nickel-insertion accessory protein CooC1
MSIFIVQLGTPRKRDEGLRVGMVRQSPRGAPKADFARLDSYDVSFPNLPSSTERSSNLDLLAVVAPHKSIAGCYCQNESRCHRS